ncbi:Late embryogenesis abundant protein [Carex littledalei]|uniref:Late embryogenesis abundant protein n=1 Tax=Carex littledalei TaxID=544730 RepID=A0A833VCF9_9POAL|nr:Late embryogenesis abundant protein [Carex littledalei]
MPQMSKERKKCLLISCSILLISIIILIIIAVILYFVMFKPKSPEINPVPVSLDHLNFTLLPVSLNITLGVNVTVKNKNYAAFKIKRTNTTIYYHEILVGEASVDPRVVSARSTTTLNTTVDIDVTTMMTSGSFLTDMASGLLPFTSETKTTGKAIVLNVFKLHATVDVSCNVGVSLIDSTTNTICNTTVHV